MPTLTDQATRLCLFEQVQNLVRGTSHAYILARGVPMTPVLAELLGRDNGLLRGKGGSMHLTSVEHGMLGSYAIVGAHLPIAIGAAWSAQYRGTQQVAVCFFGDGTTNIGAFHEALNLAAVWRRRSFAEQVLGRAREGAGPTLIEAVTYRHGGHSRADPAKYRPADEVEYWLARDPLPRYRSRLLESGVDEAALVEIEERARADVETATVEAKAGPAPSPDLVLRDVWADGGAAWRN